MTANKTVCTTTRTYFTAEAKPLEVILTAQLTVDEMDAVRKLLGSKLIHRETCQPRQFETGSMGWNLSTKASVPVGPVEQPKCQVGMNITLVGSKELPKLAATPDVKAAAA